MGFIYSACPLSFNSILTGPQSSVSKLTSHYLKLTVATTGRWSEGYR